LETKELLNGPSLVDQFPITFHNGFQVGTLVFWCPACNKIAPLDRVNGHISRLIENVVDITAAMKCPCGEVTRYRIRLKDDKTYSYLSDDSWTDKIIEDPFKKGIRNRFLARIFGWLLKWQFNKLMRKIRALHADLERLRKLK
jgi:hypothetical protein